MQTKETAINARRKMGGYLIDDNGAETFADRGVVQVLETPGEVTTNHMFSGKESDGARIRGLRRDRPAL